MAKNKSAPKNRKTNRRRPSSASVPKNSTTKAQAIRDTAQELGRKVRPKDIIAALKAKGITVSSPQVSATLKAVGLRKGRNSKPAAAYNGHSRTFDVGELLQVKKLADQLGGTARLMELAGALERLI